LKQYEDIRDLIPQGVDHTDVEVLSFQTQQLIDEVANLKLKKSEKTNQLSVESLVKRVDKDRYSALAYALYYIFVFMNEEQEEEEDEFELLSKYTFFG
jgi:ribonucleoside-diphosphate reductase alpha chain